MEYLIRVAKKEDYQAINYLAYELYHLHFLNRKDIFNDTITCLSLETFINDLNSDDNFILVVEHNKSIIAYSFFQLIIKKKTLLKCERRYLSIDDFVIAKSYQRVGIGKLLHEEIAKYAKNLNCTSIELDVYEFNKNAINFYLKLGYKPKYHGYELFL